MFDFGSLIFKTFTINLYNHHIITPTVAYHAAYTKLTADSAFGKLMLKFISGDQEARLMKYIRNEILDRFYKKLDSVESEMTINFSMFKPDIIELNVLTVNESNELMAEIKTDGTLSFNTSKQIFEHIISEIGGKTSDFEYELKTFNPATKVDELQLVFRIATTRFHNISKVLDSMRKVAKIELKNTDHNKLNSLIQLINDSELKWIGIPIKAKLINTKTSDTFVRDH